jgi:hypothetical protein
MSIPAIAAVTVHTIIRNQQEDERADRPVQRAEYEFTPRPVAKKKRGRRAKPNYFKINWSKVVRFQWF